MRYIAKQDFDILNYLVLKGEEIFIGQSEYCMDGQFDYARRVYNSDRRYLGRISDNYFSSKYKHLIEKTNEPKQH